MNHPGPGDFEFDFRQSASGPGSPGDPPDPFGHGGGEIDGPEIQPPDPPPTPGPCSPARGDRKPTAEEGGGTQATTWTPNWCAQAIMGEVVLVGDLDDDGVNRSPLSGTFEGGSIDGPLAGPLEVGFAYPITMHLVRAKEHLRVNAMQRIGPGADEDEDPADGPPHLEVGTLHLGRYCIRPDGFEHVVHCSEAIQGVIAGVSFGESFLNRDNLLSGDAGRITRDAIGFDLDLIAYMTPFVQESSLRSFRPTGGRAH